MILRSLAAALAGLAMLGGAASASSLLVNGGFEAGYSGFTTELAPVAAPGGSGLWPEGRYAIAGSAPGREVSAFHPLFSGAPHAGSAFMAVNGAAAGSGLVWSTAAPLGVLPGTVYAFTGWITLLYPDAPPSLSLAINGEEILLFAPTATVGAWVPFAARWFSGTAETASIALRNANRVSVGNDFGLDTLSFVAVPGPDSAPLLAAGLAGLFGLGRLRRRR